MTLGARDVINTLLRRCVECPAGQPSCPTCGAGETCSLIPASCDACASTTCVKTSQFAGQVSEPKASTPVGPIVGGVIAGVVAILVVVFCAWYYCIRTRRRKDTWNPPEKRDQSTLARGGIASRTHSVASTVFTRASNVIQIAYIPGVSGRSPSVPSSVPPMPTASGINTATTTPQPDTHFFMADDLRNSTWSDTSVDPRISLAPSLARASSATTVYYENAVVPPIPAQQAYRAQANMVSVKQAGSPAVSTTSGATPPKSSPLAQGGQPVKPVQINGSSIVARNVTARPIEVKKTSSGTRVPTLGNLARANSAKSAATANIEKSGPVFEEKEVVVSRESSNGIPSSPPQLKSSPSELSLGGASASAVSAVLPADGPLGRSGPSTTPDTNGLTAMIEDAIKNASANGRSPRPNNQRQDSGPFSDVHELPGGTV